jgi:Protein of unknown function (DUF3761)
MVLLLGSGVVGALLSSHMLWSGGPQPTPPPDPTTQEPTAQGPTAQGPTTQEPTTQEPTAPEPTLPEPTASDSSPACFVLDQSCNTGIGQTGLTIYYKLPSNDSSRYVCYHQAGKSPVLDYRDSSFFQNLADTGGPYCAFSNVDKNVGCALTPITEKDLMNVPPTKDEEDTDPSQHEGQTQQTSTSTNGTCVSGNDKYYTNSKGSIVQSPTCSTNGTVPAGATAQCADGSYSMSQSRRGACSSYGSISRWLVPLSSLKP